MTGKLAVPAGCHMFRPRVGILRKINTPSSLEKLQIRPFFYGDFRMGLPGRLLLDTAVAMAALVAGVIFLIFRIELNRAHNAAHSMPRALRDRANQNAS